MAAVLVAVKVGLLAVLILMAAVTVKAVVMQKVLMMGMDWIEEALWYRHHKRNMLYWRCDLHLYN